MPFIRQLDKFLRSRRLAVALILAVSAYVMVATAVPQGSRHSTEVLQFAARYPNVGPMAQLLGLHHAYTTWYFTLAVVLLALATGACALERTRGSLRISRSRGVLSETLLRRLKDHPQLTVPLPAGTRGEDALASAQEQLSALRLKGRRGPKILEAEAGKWGLLGSPLFHWTVMGLIVLIMLGQLTRSEGMMAVPLGQPVKITHDAFGLLNEGAWYGERHKGYDVSAKDFILDYQTDGQSHGPAPVAALYDGGRLLKEQRIYPNNALRYGSLMIHMNDYGLAPLFAVETSSGSVAATTAPPVDFNGPGAYGTTPAMFTVNIDGKAVGVIAQVPADRGPGGVVYEVVPKDPKVVVALTGLQSKETSATLRPGESVSLPGGNRLKLQGLTYYVRISVADDWSITPIYALFLLCGLALSLSVFVPHRTVWAFFVEGPEPSLHVVTRHYRRAAVFVEQVWEALEPLGVEDDGQAEEAV